MNNGKSEDLNLNKHALSTFEPEFRNFLSTPMLNQKKGALIKKVCIQQTNNRCPKKLMTNHRKIDYLNDEFLVLCYR